MTDVVPYEEYGYIIHIHPTGKIKRQRIIWSCKTNCHEAQTRLYVPLMRPWIVNNYAWYDPRSFVPQGGEAYPVKINGTNINPFTNPLITYPAFCGETIVVLYDYVKPKYNFSGIGPIMVVDGEDRRWTRAYTPTPCCYDCKDLAPTWCKKGYNQSVKFLESSKIFGITMPKELRDAGYNDKMTYSVNSNSIIMIGEQQIQEGQCRHSYQVIIGHTDKVIGNNVNGNPIYEPIYETRVDTGKTIQVSKCVSDISTQWEWVKPGAGPPYRKRKGSILVYCFHNGNQVIDDVLVLIISSDGSNMTSGGANFSGVFDAPQSLQVTAYYIDEGKIYYAEGNVDVTPDDIPNYSGPDVCILQLTEARVGDDDFTLGFYGTSDSGQPIWADANINPGFEISFPQVDPNFIAQNPEATAGIIGIATVTTGSMVVLTRHVGFAKAVYEIGGVGGSNYSTKDPGVAARAINAKWPKLIDDAIPKTAWIDVPHDGCKMFRNSVTKQINDARYADIQQANKPVVKVLDGIFPNSQNTAVWGGLYGSLVVSGAIELGKEQEPATQPSSVNPPNNGGEDDGGEDGGGGGGNNYIPYVPASECYYTAHYKFGESEEFWPAEPEQKPPTGELIEPKSNVYTYLVISESEIAGGGTEYNQMSPLYSLSSNILMGEGNKKCPKDDNKCVETPASYAIISYVENHINLGGIDYTASIPQSWWGFDTTTYMPRSVNLEHDKEKKEFSFKYGSIPNNTTIVIGGYWIGADNRTTSVKIIIIPDDIISEINVSGSNGAYYGNGPIFTFSPNPGCYNVSITADGYTSETFDFCINDKEHKEFTIKLLKINRKIVTFIITGKYGIPGLTVYRDKFQRYSIGKLNNELRCTWTTELLHDKTIFLFSISEQKDGIVYNGAYSCIVREQDNLNTYYITIDVFSHTFVPLDYGDA